MVFRPGQLVQVYQSAFKAERKMVSEWSQPFRVQKRVVNSYKLETLDSQAMKGEFHGQRLKQF